MLRVVSTVAAISLVDSDEEIRFYRDQLRRSGTEPMKIPPAVASMLQASNTETGIGVNQVVLMRFARLIADHLAARF